MWLVVWTFYIERKRTKFWSIRFKVMSKWYHGYYRNNCSHSKRYVELFQCFFHSLTPIPSLLLFVALYRHCHVYYFLCVVRIQPRWIDSFQRYERVLMRNVNRCKRLLNQAMPFMMQMFACICMNMQLSSSIRIIVHISVFTQHMLFKIKLSLYLV